LQHTAAHGSTRQQTAIHFNTIKKLQQIASQLLYRVLQHTNCNTLLHTAAQQHTITQRRTLQHTAAHCSTLQHTATHCNALQRTATHWRLMILDCALGDI